MLVARRPSKARFTARPRKSSCRSSSDRNGRRPCRLPFFVPLRDNPVTKPAANWSEDSHESGEPMIRQLGLSPASLFLFEQDRSLFQAVARPSRGYTEAAFFNGTAKIGLLRSRHGEATELEKSMM